PSPLPEAAQESASLDLAKSVAAALKQRPEILADQVNVRVQEVGVKLAHSGLEPQFALNAVGNYFPTTSFQAPRQRTAAVTASVSLPIWDGGVTRNRVAEARLRTENSQTELDSIRSDIALDVRRAYLNLQTAARQIDSAHAAVEQAIAA